MGFLSRLPIFPVFLQILILFRSESYFLADFISIEDIFGAVHQRFRFH